MKKSVLKNLTLAGVTALMVATLVGVTAPAANAATSVTIDGGGTGRVFDGVGAISGGGGNSRLLADYPATQRSQLLDYLFKPGYGANLQILKLEIGGDTNSTDGAEPSIEHVKGTIDCNQGYEWWLAEQAKARNPNIKIAALAWGAPGWIGNGNFWSQDMIDYIMDWFGCAAQHNLTVDYIGGWNERYYDVGWYKNLKSALTSHGYSAKVVGSDSDWGIINSLNSDSAFNSAVDIVGVHYPCGYASDFANCFNGSSDQTAAINSGKTLWASENGSEDYQTGASSVARAINRDYIDSKMTAYFNWPVIAALYPNLEFSTDGMSRANQPWSGWYDIGKTTWVTAHTTQFTQVGWHYIDQASGFLGGARTNGSYVTLKSTNNTDYTTVIETMDAAAVQTFTASVTGGLSTGTVHVYATNVGSNTSSDWFVRQSDVTPSSGTFSLTLQPKYVYTITTTLPAGAKGTATPPASDVLALPYSDDFETAATTTSPKYFSDMNGAFKTTACGGGRSGTCLRQMAQTSPIQWTDERYNAPYTLVGDSNWSNYSVSSDVMFEQAGSVDLLGRAGTQGHNNNGMAAYHLWVGSDGTWSIQKSAVANMPNKYGTGNSGDDWKFTRLTGGTVTALGTNSWHTVKLVMQDSTLSAVIDGTTVGNVDDSSYTGGLAGLGIADTAYVNGQSTVSGAGYKTQEFDNFSVTAGTNSTRPLINGGVYQLTRMGTNQLVDDPGFSTTGGTQLIVWSSNGGSNQKWTAIANSDGTFSLKNTFSNLCLDVNGVSTSAGAQIIQWTCNGGQNQEWTPTASGSGYTLVAKHSGLALSAGGTADGSLLTQQSTGTVLTFTKVG